MANDNQTRTSSKAIISLISALIGPLTCGVGTIVALVTGHLAMGQTTGPSAMRGRGLAIAGLVLGYLQVLGFILLAAGALIMEMPESLDASAPATETVQSPSPAGDDSGGNVAGTQRSSGSELPSAVQGLLNKAKERNEVKHTPPPKTVPPKRETPPPPPPAPKPTMPSDQRAFEQLIDTYAKDYARAEGEIRKSAVRADRRNSFVQYHDASAERWFGEVAKITTTSDGEVCLSIALENSKTEVSNFYDMLFMSADFEDTLIKPGSDLFEQVADLERGDKVLVSFQFMANELMAPADGLFQMRMGDSDSMRKPQFLVEFWSVQKR